jgi:hypothetical protein
MRFWINGAFRISLIGILITFGTVVWLKVLRKTWSKKSPSFYLVLFTWFPGALLYTVVTKDKIFSEETEPKELPLVNLILLIVGYILLVGLPILLRTLLGTNEIGRHWFYILTLTSYVPYLIGGFVIYNSRRKRFIVPAVILILLPLVFAIVYQSFESFVWVGWAGDVSITIGTIPWLIVLRKTWSKKSPSFYFVLLTWLPGALLYTVVTENKIFSEETKPKELPLVNLILLVVGYIVVVGLPFFLGPLGRYQIVGCEPYIFASFFVPYPIGAFLIHNSRRKRFIVPTAILLVLAPLSQSFVLAVVVLSAFA